jgi:hypothetical protein
MVTVNALKRKHLENEAKMHFTYLRQYSAHSNSTSKDFARLYYIEFSQEGTLLKQKAEELSS